MSIPISFNGTTVQIPSSGESPNWSPAIIQAFQLISQALSISSNDFDIPPQIYTLVADVNTNVDIPNLSFPTSNVQGAIIFYAVSRGTGGSAVTETGTIIINYDSALGSWEISPEFTGPGADITFSITNTGQIQFSTTSIGSALGFIYYRGLSVLSS